MSKSVTCSADGFAAALMGMLDDSRAGVEDEVSQAVRKSTALARRKVCANAKSAVGDASGNPSWRQGRSLEAGDRYPSGFSYRVQRKAHSTTGTVGNRTVPGLVHLLEKGHAMLDGGRVQAYEHVAPAAQEAFEDFEGRVGDAVGRGLAR